MNDELDELKTRYERLSLLHQVSQVIHSTLEPREAFRLILSEAVRLMRATSGSIALLNPTTGFLEIEISHGLPPQAGELKLRAGEGITGWVARTGQPALVHDVRRDPRYIRVRPSARSELAVPLEVNGEVRGVINVDSDELAAFTPDDQKLLQDLAFQAARVIHNAWLYEQLRLKARLFESLVKVGQTINSTINLDDALSAVTRETCQLMRAKMCSLLLLDESREWLDLRASFGAGPAYLSKPRLGVNDSLLGVLIRRQKALQVENVQVSTRYQNVEVARQEGLVSLLSVPLVFRGQAIGALSVYTADLHVFSNEEIRILSALADLSAIAIEKARLYEQVVDMEEQLRHGEKLSALGLLAAEVAHEIRNPLTVMKMLYHSLDLRFPEADLRARDVRVIGEKMDLLNRIVEQILDFARHTEPVLQPVDLNQVIDDLRLLIRHKLRHQNIELVTHLAPGLPKLMADATQLEQAFLNLILNASEAMPQGGTLTIQTRAERPSRRSQPPKHIQVEFKDTGCGLKPDQQRKLFHSLLATTKSKGTGLGLAIVARVVEAHRGTIKVNSRAGQGATFLLKFPVG